MKEGVVKDAFRILSINLMGKIPPATNLWTTRPAMSHAEKQADKLKKEKEIKKRRKQCAKLLQKHEDTIVPSTGYTRILPQDGNAERYQPYIDCMPSVFSQTAAFKAYHEAAMETQERIRKKEQNKGIKNGGKVKKKRKKKKSGSGGMAAEPTASLAAGGHIASTAEPPDAPALGAGATDPHTSAQTATASSASPKSRPRTRPTTAPASRHNPNPTQPGSGPGYSSTGGDAATPRSIPAGPNTLDHQRNRDARPIGVRAQVVSISSPKQQPRGQHRTRIQEPDYGSGGAGAKRGTCRNNIRGQVVPFGVRNVRLNARPGSARSTPDAGLGQGSLGGVRSNSGVRYTSYYSHGVSEDGGLLGSSANGASPMLQRPTGTPRSPRLRAPTKTVYGTRTHDVRVRWPTATAATGNNAVTGNASSAGSDHAGSTSILIDWDAVRQPPKNTLQPQHLQQPQPHQHQHQHGPGAAPQSRTLAQYASQAGIAGLSPANLRKPSLRLRTRQSMTQTSLARRQHLFKFHK